MGGSKNGAAETDEARRVLEKQPTPASPRHVLKRRLRTGSRAAALALIVLGLATLSGSFHGWMLIGTWLPGGRSITNNSSLLFVLAGASLWLWGRRPLTRSARRGAKILGALVCAGGLVLLPRFFLETAWRPDFLFFLQNSPPAEPAIFTMAAFILQGLALLFFDVIYRRINRPAEYLTLVAGLLGYISLLSYTYGLPTHLPNMRSGEMSLPGAILTLVLTFGILATRPVGLVGTLVSSGTMAGLMARWMILVLTLTPAVVSGIRLVGEWRGWFGQEMGAALAAGCLILLFGTMILSLGWLLLRTQNRRGNAERRLLSREFDSRIAFDYAPRGICQIDSRGRWIRFNNKLCSMFGYTREEFETMTFHQLLLPGDIARAEKHLAQLARGELSQYTVESRCVKKDGSLIWVSVTVTIPHGIPHVRTYAIAVAEDITGRRMAQEEIARQKAAAEAANAAKDRLISIISHELRTPLTPVLAALSGYAPDHLPPDQRNVLEMMRRNLEHEVCLIDDLLDLTRVTHGKLRLNRTTLDLHALLREVEESIRPALEAKGLSLRVLLAAQRHNVFADPARLRQVLLNLLDNAKKFTAPGGRILLVTSLRGARIVIRVRDTGIGIEPKMIGRIFEAFEQGEQSTQRRFGGLGLGLSISKGLVEAHGGTLTAESLGPGRGSTFRIELDAVDQPAATPARRPARPGRPGVKVLLVEDHEDTRLILHHMLERRGYRVFSADSVESALDIARREKAPDVLVSDIGLPGGSGLLLPQALTRECGRRVPGIALSGFAGEEDVAESLRAGFARHLVKPVEIDVLSEAIQESLPGSAPRQEA